MKDPKYEYHSTSVITPKIKKDDMYIPKTHPKCKPPNMAAGLIIAMSIAVNSANAPKEINIFNDLYINNTYIFLSFLTKQVLYAKFDLTAQSCIFSNELFFTQFLNSLTPFVFKIN